MRFIVSDDRADSDIPKERVAFEGLAFLDAEPRVSLSVRPPEDGAPWSDDIEVCLYFGEDHDPEDLSFPLKDVTNEAFAGLATRVQDLFDRQENARDAWYNGVSRALTDRASAYFSEYEGEVRVQIVFHPDYEFVAYVPLDVFKGALIADR